MDDRAAAGATDVASRSEQKVVSTFRARAAIAGFELAQLADGSFIGSKPAWGMHACLRDVPAVEAWLCRVGAPA